LTPPSGGTPCNINIVYTSLKSIIATICRRHYGSIFIRLVVAASQNHETLKIPIKFDLITVQFKVIDLGVNRKRLPISH